jgi:hypothetical protein
MFSDEAAFHVSGKVKNTFAPGDQNALMLQ